MRPVSRTYPSRLRRALIGGVRLLLANGALAMVTIFNYKLHFHVATTVMLYLFYRRASFAGD
jgi:hypothetical protein